MMFLQWDALLKWRKGKQMGDVLHIFYYIYATNSVKTSMKNIIQQ